MCHWWNDSEKLKYLEKLLSQCQFLHHKSHMDCPGTELANSFRPSDYGPTSLLMLLHDALALSIWTYIAIDPL
jgi:hypothetical protein